MRFGIFLKPLMYLDPGSGSFIIQMLLAGLLGIAVAIRIYWKKIVAFFPQGESPAMCRTSWMNLTNMGERT